MNFLVSLILYKSANKHFSHKVLIPVRANSTYKDYILRFFLINREIVSICPVLENRSTGTTESKL